MKLAKKILIALSTLTTLFVVFCVAITYWINAQDVVHALTQKLQQKTGIELKAEQAHWSFFPWIGLDLQQVNLSYPTAGQLVHLEHLEAKVALLPLFKKHVEISSVRLIHPDVMLTRYLDQSTNWGRLAKAVKKFDFSQTEEDNTQKTPLDFVLEKILLTDGQLTYNNQITHAHYQLGQLNFKGQGVRLNQDFPVSLSFEIKQNNKLSLLTQLDAQFYIDTKQRHYEFKQVQLETKIGLGHNAPQTLYFTTDAIWLDLLKNEFHQAQTHLSGDDINGFVQLHIRELTGRPQTFGAIYLTTPQLKQLLKNWNINIPTSIPSNLFNKASLTARLRATPESLSANHLSMQIDQSQLHGSINLKNFQQPEIKAELAIDQFNLDRYFPASSNTTPNNTATIHKPLLPITALRKPKLNLMLNIGQLSARGISAQNVALGIRGNQGQWSISPCQGAVLQGNFFCDVQLNVQSNTPQWTLNKTLNHVPLEPLMKHFTHYNLFSGLLNFDAQLSTAGNTTPDMLKQLRGTSQLRIEEGVIKGINLSELVFSQLSKLGPLVQNYLAQKAQAKLPPVFQKNTSLHTVIALAEFNHGKANLQQLSAQLDKAKATGQASIDLLAKTMTLDLGIQLDESISNAYLSQIIWPVHCEGPLNATPHCSVRTTLARQQIENLAKHTLEEKAKAALLKKLNLPNKQAAKALLNQKVDAEKERVKQKGEQLQEQIQKKLENKLKGFFQ